MATPRRQSARLSRGGTPSKAKPGTPSANKLSSLVERDESPDNAGPSIDALVSSPIAPNTAPNPTRFGTMSSVLKTPQTVSQINPPRSEMHPSKVQQSTMKPTRHGGPLNSHPSILPRSSSKIALAVGTHRTPTKTNNPLPSSMSSPSFDFSFERPESDLSSEAQKIMQSLRGEAAKIKAQLMEQRSKQEVQDIQADQLFGVGGREIKQAKGKSGRFSDVHKEQFKKMDSIANHASTWKSKVQGEASSASLKRSPSKAGLDDTPKSLPRAKSYKDFYSGNSERLENTAPSKRAKRAVNDDTSVVRPVSQDSSLDQQSTLTSTTKIPLAGLPSAVSTPTKASLARSASVKSLKTSMIPSLTRSASTKTLGGPVAPMTEGSNKRLGSWAKFGGNMKSILHRAQPKFSNDPTKVAAGTHLPLPQGKVDLDKDLPHLPETPTIKRVNFSSSTKSRHENASPSKIPTLFAQASQSSSPPPLASMLAEPVNYPDLAASPNITTRAKSPKPISTSTTSSAGPGDFTFRAENTITFDAPSTFTSPNGTTTIRQVRPSGVPTTMPGSLEDSMPAIPHGITNKKRKHVSDLDERDSDAENVAPNEMAVDAKSVVAEDDGPKAKKQRVTGPPSSSTSPVKSPTKRRLTGAGASGRGGHKKGGLSLSRLNMLARPKERR